MVHKIISLLSAVRIPLHSEDVAQASIARVLVDTGISGEREVRLDAKNRIDLMVGDIGIEVKLKGGAKEIYRQCERYCKFDRIKTLILVTNRSMGFPESVNGKSCYVIKLGRSWL